MRPNKGVNLPNTKINLPAITNKDMRDLDFCLENNIEWIALSFVRAASDYDVVTKIIKEAGYTTPVMGKIEKWGKIESWGKKHGILWQRKAYQFEAC